MSIEQVNFTETSQLKEKIKTLNRPISDKALKDTPHSTN